MGKSVTTVLRSALKPAIVTQLATDGILGVQVSKFSPGDDVQSTDAIWFGKISGTQDEANFGGSREETLDVEGFLLVTTPGAGDTIAATSEDRAFTILASIETALRADATLSAVVFDAVITDTSSEPGMSPEGRYTFLTFTITATAYI